LPSVRHRATSCSNGRRDSPARAAAEEKEDVDEWAVMRVHGRIMRERKRATGDRIRARSRHRLSNPALCRQ